MQESLWHYLTDVWAKLYYTELIWLICSAIALLVGIRNYRKEMTYQLLLIYTVSSIWENIGQRIVKHSFSLEGINSTAYVESTNTFFSLVEITTFAYIFKKLLKTKLFKITIEVIWLIFSALCVYFLYKIFEGHLPQNEIKNYSFILNSIEFFILLFLCLPFFYQLLVREFTQVVPISKSPAFWITSGLFFYCIVSLPILLIGDKLFTTNYDLLLIVVSIHFASNSLLFLCIAKAFSCKTTLTI